MLQVDIFHLAAKKIIALKCEVDKLDISKLTNVPTVWIIQKHFLKNSKVDDLDVGKLESVPINFKNASDVVHNEVVKNIKFNRVKTKVNNLGKKISDTTTNINSKKIRKKNWTKKN